MCSFNTDTYSFYFGVEYFVFTLDNVLIGEFISSCVMPMELKVISQFGFILFFRSFIPIFNLSVC